MFVPLQLLDNILNCCSGNSWVCLWSIRFVPFQCSWVEVIKNLSIIKIALIFWIQAIIQLEVDVVHYPSLFPFAPVNFLSTQTGLIWYLSIHGSSDRKSWNSSANISELACKSRPWNSCIYLWCYLPWSLWIDCHKTKSVSCSSIHLST